MHRKFIALILASALAITGLSAAPARADGDTARLLAGLAALALIGAAIQKNHRRDVVSRDRSPIVRPQPLPLSVSRFDLPKKCVRRHSVNGWKRQLAGAWCLKRNYAHNGSLPNACRLDYREGHRNRTGYAPQCLRNRGYRFTRS